MSESCTNDLGISEPSYFAALKAKFQLIYAFISSASTFTAPVRTLCQPIPQNLHNLYQNHQGYHGDNHDVGFVAIVAKADGQVTNPAAADDTRHGGITDQADQGHRQATQQPRRRLRQQNRGDNPQRAGAEGLSRLNNAGIDFTQRPVDQTGVKSDRGYGQRHRRGNRTYSIAQQKLRQRQQNHQQDHKGNRANKIYQ